MIRTVLTTAMCWVVLFNSFAQVDQVKVEAFISKYATSRGVSEAEVREIIGQAEFQLSIVEKFNRPAEKTMTWSRYRNIFMKEERIESGLAFWKTHETALQKVSAETGVPEHIILGILGVESAFGDNKGSYRVLDALYTISFGIPRRSSYFTKELGEFLDLVKAEKLDPLQVLGGYAGAMGYCQFMPSSYRAYAKSYDDGGTRDLMGSPEDAIASVANYLKVHRWKADQKVAVPAVASANANPPAKFSSKVKYDVAHYQNLGFDPEWELTPTRKVSLLEFQLDEGKEYWFGLYNFYVITRYNHSSMYALVVYQLGEAINKRRGGL
ncbi:MAG: lytic murein transglycosylase B [Cytophagales bacterium]|nr:lytic murein transglycosylase B [Cytophagales bacterium]